MVDKQGLTIDRVRDAPAKPSTGLIGRKWPLLNCWGDCPNRNHLTNSASFCDRTTWRKQPCQGVMEAGVQRLEGAKPAAELSLLDFSIGCLSRLDQFLGARELRDGGVHPQDLLHQLPGAAGISGLEVSHRHVLFLPAQSVSWRPRPVDAGPPYRRSLLVQRQAEPVVVHGTGGIQLLGLPGKLERLIGGRRTAGEVICQVVRVLTGYRLVLWDHRLGYCFGTRSQPSKGVPSR